MVRLFSLLALLGIAPFASAQRPVAPIDVRAQWTPTYFRSQAHTVVAYELRVTNVSTREITLKQLDVFGDALTGRHLIQLQADSLRDAIATVGVRDTTIPPTQIRSGRQVIVFVWLDLGSGVKAPATLVHRFLLGRPDSAAKPPDTVGPVRIAVSSAPPIVLSTPLDHGLWVARHGPSNIADHRRTVISVNGVSTIAQRFATDWIMLGPDHRMWHGDSTVNRNWYGYGTTIHAAANGVVVAEHDGIPENVPLSPTRAVPITLETVAGNFVIERLDDGSMALYAHMQPGSLKVKTGQRLQRGQTIGLLGNSGNSGAPHLHFHLMAGGDSPLAGEGIPFGFRQYVDEGIVPDMDALFAPAPWQPTRNTLRRNDLPSENMIVGF